MLLRALEGWLKNIITTKDSFCQTGSTKLQGAVWFLFPLLLGKSMSMDPDVQGLNGLERNGKELGALLSSGGYLKHGNPVLVHPSNCTMAKTWSRKR